MIAQYYVHALEEYIKGQPGLNVSEIKKATRNDEGFSDDQPNGGQRMTSPNLTTEAEKWQQQYTAANSQWQDMKRSGEITVVIAFLMVVATLYAFGYAMSQFDRWLFGITSQALFSRSLDTNVANFPYPSHSVICGLTVYIQTS